MKKILVTGGCGKIGRHFVQSVSSQYQIRIADLNTAHSFDPEVEVVEADLSDYEACQKVCEGIDQIIHLAGIPDPEATFVDLLPANMLATQNIFRAAVVQGCQRVIYASSAQTIESYPLDVSVTENMPVKPKNLYGVSKCFGEAIAAYYAHQEGLSAICLRIGCYEFPEDHETLDARDLSAYLHPDDLNHLLIRAMETENIQYEVLNAISNNRFKRLDLTRTIEVLNYQPQADAFGMWEIL